MKRLLFITHRLPYPPDKGERTRAFHEIVALSERFEVAVASLCSRPSRAHWADELRQWAAQVLVAPMGRLALLRGAGSLLRGRSVTEGYFHSRRLAKLIALEQSRRPFDVVVGYSSGVLPYVLSVDAPLRVMDLVDADSAKWSSYAVDASGPLRWAYRREACGVRGLEARALDACDAVVVVSQAEADQLGPEQPKVHVIANGVDVDTFREDAVRPAKLGPAALVFLGSMDYRPNVEGVTWFVRHVWPEIHRQLENATFTIVGRNPTRSVRSLNQTPGVSVTGSVSDARPYLAGATAVVCPLQTSRGVPNKILEAMAMGRPVVASPVALQGLDLAVGSDVLQADSSVSWQVQCLGLLTGRGAAESLGRAARACVTDHYAWPARLQPLVDLCAGAVAPESVVQGT